MTLKKSATIFFMNISPIQVPESKILMNRYSNTINISKQNSAVKITPEQDSPLII